MRKIPLSLFVFSLLLVANLLSGCSHQEQSSAFGNATQTSSDGADIQKAGILSTSDYQRLTVIEKKVVDGDTITDSEVDWLLSLTNRPGTEYQKNQRMLYVVIALANPKPHSFPASRSEAIFQFATQAASHNGSPTGISYLGCQLLGKLKDKRGLAYLKPLLASNNISVQHAARRAIHSISKP